MQVGLIHFLSLAAILFGIGLYGVLTRRNAIVILIYRNFKDVFVDKMNIMKW